MAGLNIKKFLNNFTKNYNQQTSTGKTITNSSNNVQTNKVQVSMDTSGPKLPAQNALHNVGQNIKTVAQNFKLNVLQNVDRSTYLKDVLNLPKNMNEFVFMVQKGLNNSQLSKILNPQQQNIPSQSKPLTQIQSQILAQQGQIMNTSGMQTKGQDPFLRMQQNSMLNQGQILDNPEANAQGKAFVNSAGNSVLFNKNIEIKPQIKTQPTPVQREEIPTIEINDEVIEIPLSKELQGQIKKLEILSNGMINLSKVSQLIQQNGKNAVTKLIMAMTEASKSGISDLSQMKEMAKFVNASMSIAAENNPQKTLKLLILLYLPWLPLEDGVGFDIQIEEHKSDEQTESDSILVITVTTINYGVVRATLILETSNSVQVDLETSEKFPRNELKLRIEKEQGYYSMDSVLNFRSDERIKSDTDVKQSANINMSKTTEINPFLLLMAHTLIKHIIDIDNNKTLGITSHDDFMP